MSNIKNKKK